MILCRSLFCLLGTFIVCQSSMAQVFVQDDGAGNSFTFASGSSLDTNGELRLSALVSDPSILDEIEAVPSQREQIRNAIHAVGLVNSSANDKLLNILRTTKSPEDRIQAEKAFRDAIANSRDKFEATVKSNLLPHQLRQIGSVVLSRMIKSQGLTSLAGAQIGRALDLNPEEQEALAKKTKEVNQRLQKDIANLKKKAMEEVLLTLPSEKRQLLKDRFDIDLVRSESKTDEDRR